MQKYDPIMFLDLINPIICQVDRVVTFSKKTVLKKNNLKIKKKKIKISIFKNK